MTDQLQAATTPVAARPRAAASPLGPVALTTLLFGAFLPMLSFFIINVALPAIGSDLSATSGELQLVVGSYGIANATLLVVGGRLGDGFGRKRLFLIGLTGFTVMSLICAIAPTIGVLLAARVVQGATAAADDPAGPRVDLQPRSPASTAPARWPCSVSRAVPRPRSVRSSAAYWSRPTSSTSAGGRCSSSTSRSASWPWLAAIRLLPETKADKAQRVDLVGAALLALTLVLLLLPLTEGRPLGWPLGRGSASPRRFRP